MERVIKENDNARHLMWMSIMISIIFAIVFSIIVGFMTNRISELSESNKVAIHDQCLNANISRANQIELWESLIRINKEPTPEQQINADTAMLFVRQIFAERQCPE